MSKLNFLFDQDVVTITYDEDTFTIEYVSLGLNDKKVITPEKQSFMKTDITK
jgi:hypothetical protein